MGASENLPLKVSAYRPFPTDALPEPARSLVEAASRAIGCDTSYIALPLLSAAAGAIGNSRRVELKSGWSEPAVIWAAVVGESGSQKSPAQELALTSLRRRQDEAIDAYDKQLREFDRAVMVHEASRKEWMTKGRKADEQPPEEPVPPSCRRILVSDTTLEALVDRLRENPRGLFLEVDELSGFLRSFDKYRAGKGGDVGSYLSMHRCGSIIVDRKSTGSPTLVRAAAVSICGGIQPAVLWESVGREHVENGLLARFLLAYPPKRKKRWSEATVPNEIRERVDRMFDQLLSVGADTSDSLQTLPLTLEAKAVWVEFYALHAIIQADATGDLAAAAHKIEAYAARLALVCQLIEDPEAVEVGEDAMRRGVALARWFYFEAKRVYNLRHEAADSQDMRRLAEWIAARGGLVTARQVQQGNESIKTAEEAEAALDSLRRIGLGEWEDVPPGADGGRPTRVFQLAAPFSGGEPGIIYGTSPNFEETGGFVDKRSSTDAELDEVGRQFDEACKEEELGDDPR